MGDKGDKGDNSHLCILWTFPFFGESTVWQNYLIKSPSGKMECTTEFCISRQILNNHSQRLLRVSLKHISNLGKGSLSQSTTQAVPSLKCEVSIFFRNCSVWSLSDSVSHFSNALCTYSLFWNNKELYNSIEILRLS